MNKLNLITFASELNKQGSIRASHQELFTTLEKEYVVNIIEPKQLETLQTDDLQLVFISSGGVEFSFYFSLYFLFYRIFSSFIYS